MFKPVTTAKQRTMNIPVISNPIPATIFFIQYTPLVKMKYRKTPTSRVHSAMFKGAHSHPRCSYIHIFADSITIPSEDVSRRKAMLFFRSSENRNSVSTNESALFGHFLKVWDFLSLNRLPILIKQRQLLYIQNIIPLHGITFGKNCHSARDDTAGLFHQHFKRMK